MSSHMNNGRVLVMAMLSAAILATSGCSWMRSKTGYELSPESRPLAIPPELNAPVTTGGFHVPAVSTARPASASQAFVLSDDAASAYGRVGIALGRIDGVSINERSQLLGLYTVSYEGDTILVRVAAEGDKSRVSAANSEGREAADGAGAKLLGLLRDRLG